ncbi:RabGAP/TBC protein [Haematococcus lacustris]
MHDAAGRLVSGSVLQQRAWTSGLQPAVRRDAWRYLLGLHAPGSSAAERAAAAADRRRQYHSLRSQWQSIGAVQAARFSHWRERRVRVDKDVRRTDRTHPFFVDEHGAALKALRRMLLTYSMFNFDIGYCQGMSDLASPLLVVLRDESEAFWAFCALMDRMGANFDDRMQGMHAQMLAMRKLMQLLDPQLHAHLEAHDCLTYFFAFRWLLILFKREFRFEEVLRLWEALWSAPCSPHLHLYLACAVLVHHRRAVLQQVQGLDDMLKLSLGLQGALPLEQLLRLAAVLCRHAGQAGRECLAELPMSCQRAMGR